MAKLVPLNEAAQMLGVTPDELNELRQRNDIYGYRDGASWKFKVDDIEQLKANRDATVSGDDATEFFLPTGSGGSDLLLVPDEPAPLAPESSVDLDQGLAKALKPESDLDIIPESQSDVRLAGDSALGGSSGLNLGGSDETDFVLGGSDIPLDLADPSASKTVLKGGSGPMFAGQSSVQLGGESLVDSPSGGSSILGDDEDVLGGSGPGSDITHRPGDSGILLIDPADSGLSLEKPLDLGPGSDLKLKGSGTNLVGGLEETDMLEIQGDDNFELTPFEESGEEDSESGSQVIMLDSEGEFDDATATLMRSQLPGMVEPSLTDAVPGGLAGGLGARGGPVGGVIIPPGMVVVPKETPFSVLSVFGLAACTVAMIMCGVMMYDLVRNIWSWDAPYAFNSTLMEAMLGN